MPPIKSFVLERRVFLAISISLDRKIVSPYFYYAKKRLIYVVLATHLGRQPSFYLKYIKVNTYLLYDMRLISINK